MYGMKLSFGPLTSDLGAWQMALFLICIAFVAAILLISTDLPMHVTQQVIASTPSEDEDEDEDGDADDEEPEDSNGVTEGSNFVTEGDIGSIIHTPNAGQWNATGQWGFSVADGSPRTLRVYMVWENGTSSHTHGFENFQTNDNIVLSSDRSFTIDGTANILTDGITTWPDAGLEIVMNGGKMIKFTADAIDTQNHFWEQSVFGTVKEFKPCIPTPGPGMILTECP
jgi:hypothetical protein